MPAAIGQIVVTFVVEVSTLSNPELWTHCAQRNEVIHTDASFAVFFLQAVASTARRKNFS